MFDQETKSEETGSTAQMFEIYVVKIGSEGTVGI